MLVPVVMNLPFLLRFNISLHRRTTTSLFPTAAQGFNIASVHALLNRSPFDGPESLYLGVTTSNAAAILLSTHLGTLS